MRHYLQQIHWFNLLLNLVIVFSGFSDRFVPDFMIVLIQICRSFCSGSNDRFARIS